MNFESTVRASNEGETRMKPVRGISRGRRGAGLIAAAVALSLSAAACGNASSVTQPSATQPSTAIKMTTINVAYLGNMQSGSALTAAINKGYFAQEHLKVNPVQFQTGPLEVNAMKAGSIQFLSVGPGIMYLPMKGEGKYLFSDAVSLADSVVASKSAGVTTLVDLKGKSVLVPLGSTGELILLEALHKAGLKLSDVHMINTAPAEQVTAFLAGSAPVMAGWAPITTQILNKDSNAITIASDPNFYPSTSFPVNWAVDNSYAQNNPSVVSRFVRAMERGATYRTQHLSQVAGWLASLSKVPLSLILESEHQTKWFTGSQIAANYQSGAVAKWMGRYNQLYIQEGILTSTVPFDQYSLGSVAVSARKGS